MVQFFESISPNLSEWALKQPVFFTASAPLAGKHVNISPKGLPSTTFTIFDGNHAAYVDATGSGSETIAHIYENGRVTIMFCSFDATPRIMRLFCKGRVVEWDDAEFEPLMARMAGKRVEGARAVILLDVWKVQTSCGYGVPKLAQKKIDEEKAVPFLEDRETMGHWASKKIQKNELHAYQKEWNSDSLDGLTGMKVARRDRGETLWITDLKAYFRRVTAQREAMAFGVALAFIMYLITRIAQAILFSS